MGAPRATAASKKAVTTANRALPAGFSWVSCPEYSTQEAQKVVTDPHAVDEGERFVADTTTSFGPVSIDKPPNNRPEASAPWPTTTALPLSDLMPPALGRFECAAQNCSLVLPSCARPDEDGKQETKILVAKSCANRADSLPEQTQKLLACLADFSSAGASKIMFAHLMQALPTTNLCALRSLCLQSRFNHGRARLSNN